MHGDSHKPQIEETLSSWQNLLSYLASRGQRGASGIVSDLFRPHVQEAFLQVYQAIDDDALSIAYAPEKG